MAMDECLCDRIRWLLQALMDERIVTFLRFAAMGFNTFQWMNSRQRILVLDLMPLLPFCHVMGSVILPMWR